MKKIDGSVSISIDARVIGDESDSPAAQGAELIPLEYINTGVHSAKVARRSAAVVRDGVTGYIRSEGNNGLRIRRRNDALADKRGHLAAQPIDVPFGLGMDPIAQKNQRRLTAGIDPNAGAGETSMAKTSEGE